MTEVSAQLTAAPPITRKRIDALFREWGAMLDEARRTQVLVCVSDTHSGPPLRIHDPEHGTLILCSPDQAEDYHRRVPMHPDWARARPRCRWMIVSALSARLSCAHT